MLTIPFGFVAMGRAINRADLLAVAEGSVRRSRSCLLGAKGKGTLVMRMGNKSPLNNSFVVPPGPRHHVGSNMAVESGSENEGTKKPQLPQDHPQVVTCAAQYRVHRIAERAFEPVPIEFSVCLHVADGGLDCTSPPDHRT
jgi:hypothetical protein